MRRRTVINSVINYCNTCCSTRRSRRGNAIVVVKDVCSLCRTNVEHSTRWHQQRHAAAFAQQRLLSSSSSSPEKKLEKGKQRSELEVQHLDGGGYTDNKRPQQTYYKNDIDESRQQQALVEFTDAILDARHPQYRAIGTLLSSSSSSSLVNQQQWDDCISAMVAWLRQPLRVDDDDVKLSGYAVDTVERILRRLRYEHATTALTANVDRSRCILNNERDWTLQQWDLAVLRAWLLLSQQSSPASAIAAERAHRILDGILRRRRRRQEKVHGRAAAIAAGTADVYSTGAGPSSLFDECVGVTRAWIRTETPDGMQRAISMLAPPGVPEDVEENDINERAIGGMYFPILKSNKKGIVPLYHEALKQTVRLVSARDGGQTVGTGAHQHVVNANLLSSAFELNRFMILLAHQDEDWDGIHPTEEETASLANLLLTTDNDMGTGLDRRQSTALSSFEMSALQKQLIGIINNASAGDEKERRKINDLVQKWSNASIRNPGAVAPATGRPSSSGLDIYMALTRYYIRMKDPHVATTWLRKVEAVSGADEVANSSEGSWRVGLYEELVRLWGRTEDHQAPWRADELLRRLEDAVSNDEGDSVGLPESLYSLVAGRWIHLGRGDKLLDLCLNSRLFPESLLPTALPQSLQLLVEGDGSSFVASSDALARVFKELPRIHAMLNEKDRVGLTEDLASVIRHQKLPDFAVALAEYMSQNNMIPNSIICERLAGSFPEDTSPEVVLDLLYKLEGECGADLSFGCYKSAIDSLLVIRGKPKFDGMINIIGRLLTDIRESRLDVEAEDLGKLLHRVLRFCRFARREQSALAILRLAEEQLLMRETLSSFSAFPIPMECYRDVATSCFVKGKTETVEELFEKVRQYQYSGFEDMTPDSKFYNLMMASLGQKGPQASLEKRVELLHELISHYSSTRDDRFKPLDLMFIEIFKDLEADATVYHAEQAVSLAGEMARVGVKVHSRSPKSAFGLNIVMHLVLQSGMEGAFQTVMELRSHFEALDIEPDAHTLHNILKACSIAKNGDLQLAVRTGLESFARIREMGRSHETTYLHLLQLLRNAREVIEVEEIVPGLFDSCQQDCLLSAKVQNEFREVVSPDTWQNLCSSGGTKWPN